MLRRLFLAAFLALGVTAAASSAPTGAFTLHGSVSRVVDGDTVHVLLASGRDERVRLIGIDTPEVGQCFAARATAEARRLADGRDVVLKGDATQSTRDRYGRLLAYVWLPGGKDLGFQQLAAGVARVYVYDRPFQRLSAYRRAEQTGRRRTKSLWHCGTGGPKPKPGGRCDPSYPTVCIPPPPPDLDCADVPYTNFKVVGADPHHFDGNHNGVGCER
jgi:micrococcal nuclease